MEFRWVVYVDRGKNYSNPEFQYRHTCEDVGWDGYGPWEVIETTLIEKETGNVIDIVPFSPNIK